MLGVGGDGSEHNVQMFNGISTLQGIQMCNLP